MPIIQKDIVLSERKIFKIAAIAIGVLMLLVVGWIIYKKYIASRISSGDTYVDPTKGSATPTDPQYTPNASNDFLAKINLLFNKTLCSSSDEHEAIIKHLLTKNNQDLIWLSGQYEIKYKKTLLRQIMDLSWVCYARFNGKKSELIDRLKSIGIKE